jgi:hypothetical protein
VLFFGTGILTKEDFNNFLWTIVFLAMGGIALGKAVTSSGLLESLDALIQDIVQGMPIWKVLFSLLAIGLVVATFISHTIAAVLLVPIAAQVGDSLAQPHPRLLIMATTLTASAAMGLVSASLEHDCASPLADSSATARVRLPQHGRVGTGRLDGQALRQRQGLPARRHSRIRPRHGHCGHRGLWHHDAAGLVGREEREGAIRETPVTSFVRTSA